MLKTITIQIDERLSEVIDSLKDALGMTSRADVFRTSVALLKIALEAEKEGMRLAVVADGKLRRELVFPWMTQPASMMRVNG
jgi:hypothetical protein